MLCVLSSKAKLSGRRIIARQTFVRTCFALIGAIFVAGCGVTHGQLDAIGSFGKSTSTLADGAKAAYAQAAQDEREVRFSKYAVLSSAEVINEGYRNALIPLTKEKIKGRLAAVDALEAYGKALSTLLDSKSQESDFSAAATTLTSSLKGIPEKTLKDAKIDPADIASLGKIVIAFGNLYLDYRRREVLEQVVPAAQPVITKLCRMFAKDFDVKGGLLRTMFKTEFGETLGKTRARLKLDRDDIPTRATLLGIYDRIDGLKIQVSTRFDSLKAASESCIKASRKLADAVENPKVSLPDIADFAAKAQAAYSAVHATFDDN